jgi:hypothetical protein
VSIIVLLFLSGAEAYTVVFKSGRTLDGTLISETASTILFKDASGIQVSLKKSLLNLDRMAELNAPQAAPATPSAPPEPAVAPVPATAKKPAKGQKVFTNADIPGATPPEQPTQPEETPSAPTDQAQTPEKPETEPTPPVPPVAPKPASSKKEGKVFTNDDVVPPPEPKPESPAEESQTQPASPQTGPAAPSDSSDSSNYVQDLKSGATQLSKALQDLSALTDGIAVNWEVAASTGNDYKRSVHDYMSGATASAIMNNVSQQLSSLQALQTKLSNVPAGNEQSYQIFSRSVDALKSFYTQVQQYDSIKNVTLLKSRLAELSSQINSAVSALDAAPKKTA